MSRNPTRVLHCLWLVQLTIVPSPLAVQYLGSGAVASRLSPNTAHASRRNRKLAGEHTERSFKPQHPHPHRTAQTAYCKLAVSVSLQANYIKLLTRAHTDTQLTSARAS